MLLRRYAAMLMNGLFISARGAAPPAFSCRHAAQADGDGRCAEGDVEGYAQAAGNPGAAERRIGTRVVLQRQSELLHCGDLLRN
jgi:hypothetical protein